MSDCVSGGEESILKSGGVAYNIKEALAGVDGVEQLVDVVLHEGQRGMRQQAELHAWRQSCVTVRKQYF